MCDRVNVLYVHIVRDVEADGGVVQYRFNTRFHQLVSSLLRGGGRDGKNRNFDFLLFDLFGHHGCIKDLKVPNFLPDLRPVVIEYCDHPEAPVGEAVVMSQRVTDITHANDSHIPDTIHLQNVTQAFDQELDRIASALLAEFSEL